MTMGNRAAEEPSISWAPQMVGLTHQQWLAGMAADVNDLIRGLLDACGEFWNSQPNASLAVALIKASKGLLDVSVTPLMLANVISQVDDAMVHYQAELNARLAVLEKWRASHLAMYCRRHGVIALRELLTPPYVTAVGSAVLGPWIDSSAQPVVKDTPPDREEIAEISFSRQADSFSDSIVVQVGRTSLRMSNLTLARLLEVATAVNSSRLDFATFKTPTTVKVTRGQPI